MTNVVIDTTDGPMPSMVARPTRAPRGALVVIPEAFGLTQHIRSVCDRLASAGWLTLAPGIYHRDGNQTFRYAELAESLKVMARLNPEGLRVDLRAGYAYLDGEGVPTDRVGVVGFCMGGAISLWAATIDPIGAAVTWYGGGVAHGRFGLPPLLELAPSLRRPWLGLYGDRDHSIETSDVAELGLAASQAEAVTELVRYPDAGHGFNNDDRADHYRPAAARDAWTRMLDWFDRHVGDTSA